MPLLAPALNSAICWKHKRICKSAGNQQIWAPQRLHAGDWFLGLFVTKNGTVVMMVEVKKRVTNQPTNQPWNWWK